jgi:hypothetical protein
MYPFGHIVSLISSTVIRGSVLTVVESCRTFLSLNIECFRQVITVAVARVASASATSGPGSGQFSQNTMTRDVTLPIIATQKLKKTGYYNIITWRSDRLVGQD